MNLNPFNRLLTGLLELLLLTSAPTWADEAQADPWGAATTTTPERTSLSTSTQRGL